VHPFLALDGKIYELGNKEGYRQFWAIYHKPPKARIPQLFIGKYETV
jgi:hypothetical protein